MAESVRDLCVAVSAAAHVCENAYTEGGLETAQEAARAILSAGSKLHARLGVLVDLRDDAGWRAAVDRAVKRTPPPKPELVGQTSLAETLAPPAPKPKRKPKS
jgi:hypothetical protein